MAERFMRYSGFFFVSALVAAMAFFRGDLQSADHAGTPGGVGPARVVPGAETLIFAVAPQPRSGPIMPDLPWELIVAAPDPLPTVDKTPPDQTMRKRDKPAASLGLPRKDPALRQVTANALNLRTGPSSGYPAIKALHAGEQAVISGPPRDGWVPVRIVTSGQRGWVFHRYLASVNG